MLNARLVRYKVRACKQNAKHRCHRANYALECILSACSLMTLSTRGDVDVLRRPNTFLLTFQRCAYESVPLTITSRRDKYSLPLCRSIHARSFVSVRRERESSRFRFHGICVSGRGCGSNRRNDSRCPTINNSWVYTIEKINFPRVSWGSVFRDLNEPRPQGAGLRESTVGLRRKLHWRNEWRDRAENSLRTETITQLRRGSRCALSLA